MLLAIPPLRLGAPNCALTDQDKNGRTRFIAESDMIPDENTGLDEKSLKVGRKNIQILLDTEDAGDMQTLPIARIRRDGSGNYIYDESFIPPCTQISASPTLMLMTRRLIDMLQEKSATMSLDSRGKGKFQTGFSAQEIGQFWFLHAINSSLGPLRHLFLSKRGHPEELFLELLRLGGALCTFSLDSQPRNLPLYNHMALDMCFAEVEKHIHEHLELLAPSNCLSIPLKPVANYFYEGAITDQRCLDRARWMISVHAAYGRCRCHYPDAATGKGLLRAIRSPTGEEGAARHGIDARSGSSLRRSPAGGKPILFHWPRRAVLGSHRANSPRGNLHSG